jgi:serine/threonine protein kinase/tetratricopeptide (TPR) repeat protein
MAIKCPKCNVANPDIVKFCGECGTQLIPTKEICASPTETLQTPVKELTTGSTFAGRYQIIEELGHGGMGRVYKVHDTKIGEKIALKLIRPEAGLDKKSLERFSNELKLARKIRHKYVCQMFDLGEDQGTRYITMEYVHGEDLKQLIRKVGRLSPGQAIGIARQVCDGLEEAHKLGVVHRDLKPQNIMVDEDGKARIMDFGIARSLSGKSMTGAGVMIGTPEYMSPEQVEGKDIDQRSDIYSLGVILYEMVTGRLPFIGETPLSVAHKHKYEAPEDPKKLNTQVSDDLARVILKCLAKDEDKRFRSAAELGAELGRIEEGLPTTDRLVAERKTITSREITLKFTPKRLLVPGFVVLVLIAAGIILLRILPSKSSAPPPSASGQPTLAVLYFENKSGDPKLDNWRDGLTELLIGALSQSRYIRVVSSDQLYTILKRLGLADARKYSSEDIEKIAAQTRATHVLRGSYIKAGESFIITAGLQKPGTGESPTALRLEARDEKDIIPKIDELTRQVKEGLNLTATQIAGDIEKEAGKITTSSPDALKYYIEGRRLQENYENEKSIPHMEKAVAIDPEFAMAYRSMGVAHQMLGHVAEARNCYKKALDLSDRLPENERLLIEAIWLAVGEENYAKAIEVLERLVKIYPGHMLGHSWLGASYSLAGNLDKTIEHQEFVVQNEKTADQVASLAEYYMAKGLYQKAEDLCRSFLKDVEDSAQIHFTLGCSYLCRRQFDLAIAEQEKAYLLNPTFKDWMGCFLLCKDDLAGADKYSDAVSFLTRGKFTENINLSQRFLEESKGDKVKERYAYNGLVGALEKASRYEDAYSVFGQYLKLSAEYRKSTGESGLPYLPSQQKSDLFTRGRIQAEMKSFDEAQKTAEELKSLIEKSINTKELRWYECILGLIELGKKDYRQAADLFGRACGRLHSESEWSEWSFGEASYFEASYFDNLARALYESGDLDIARKTYEKITLLTLGRINDGDRYAKAYYMLGKIAEQQGDKVRARENYRKFLDLWKDADPGLPEVEDAKKRLAGLK